MLTKFVIFKKKWSEDKLSLIEFVTPEERY